MKRLPIVSSMGFGQRAKRDLSVQRYGTISALNWMQAGIKRHEVQPAPLVGQIRAATSLRQIKLRGRNSVSDNMGAALLGAQGPPEGGANARKCENETAKDARQPRRRPSLLLRESWAGKSIPVSIG